MATQNFWEDAEVIHTYSRAEAIEDGTLVDLMTDEAIARTCSHYFKYPMACTERVWHLIEQVVAKDPQRRTPATILSKVLRSSFTHYTRKSETAVWFEILEAENTHLLQLACGPGDDAEPVMTLMFADED